MSEKRSVNPWLKTGLEMGPVVLFLSLIHI